MKPVHPPGIRPAPGAGRPAGTSVLLALCCLGLAGSAGCRTTPAQPAAGPEPVALQRTVKKAPQYFVYEVGKGDTLYGLGERFGVGWREIAATNDIGPPYRLRVGSVLLLPRVEGVEVPEPAPPRPAPAGPVERLAVARAELHRGKPSATYWWPTGGRLARSYAQRVRGLPEPGIGIAAPRGTEVYAVAGGTVVTVLHGAASPGSAWGNVVAVSHAGGVVSWYGQLDRILVRKWQKVAQGEPIGTVGQSGAVTRPELALRMFRNARFVDPQQHLP
jgi:murein DD-endopeptidase MepM/ murein hydrolase activator NlpD